ncbi:response regulator [Flavobacterium sp.]|uniref:response regulator n=1 Tax=Flavobacterium sp. TaxID=239 RepID=UPI0037504A14
MTTNQTQNLFIVEDNPESALKLHQFLATRFGTIFNIFTFSDSVKALEKIDKNTTIVVLDYDYFGEKGNKILKFIKTINPNTKVIILSNHDDIGAKIESYKNGATDFIVKDTVTEKKLDSKIFSIISYSSNYLQLNYTVTQFLFYVLFLCFLIGVFVFVAMQIFH